MKNLPQVNRRRACFHNPPAFLRSLSVRGSEKAQAFKKKQSDLDAGIKPRYTGLKSA